MKVLTHALLAFCCAAILLGCSKLTRENYEKIEVGMAYEAVVGIIGEPDTCDAALGTKKCIWGTEEKNITISFMGEQVIMPSYKGL